MMNSPQSLNARRLKRYALFTVGWSIPVALAFFFGCTEIKEEKAPIGVEVAPEVIEEALQKSLEGSSVHSVVKDQQVVFALTQQIENNPPRPYLYMKQHVLEVEDTPDWFAFKYREITEDPNAEPGTKPKVIEKDSPKYIPRPPGATSLSQTLAALGLEQTLLFSESRAETLASETPVVRTTYHELIVQREIQSPPLYVRERTNCGQVAQCQLRVTKIQFDQINWFNDSDYQKIRYNLEITPDAPYLSRILSDCIATQIPYGERTVYIKECQKVLDFWNGTAPAP